MILAQCEGTARHGGGLFEVIGHIVFIFGSRFKGWYSASFFCFLSFQSGTLVHGMVLPTVRESLPFSIRPLQKSLTGIRHTS